MDLFEYQGKELLRRFEVPVPEGRVASTPDEAASAAAGLGGKVVVKAQVQVGGRGKAGGIKIAESAGRGPSGRRADSRDGHQRPHSQTSARRASRRHQRGVLPLSSRRPR